MKKNQIKKRLYVAPDIVVIETEPERHLLLGSQSSGGHEDAEDEEFETLYPGDGGHNDAEDEAW